MDISYLWNVLIRQYTLGLWHPPTPGTVEKKLTSEELKYRGLSPQSKSRRSRKCRQGRSRSNCCRVDTHVSGHWGIHQALKDISSQKLVD
jgi:hypothetical protein